MTTNNQGSNSVRVLSDSEERQFVALTLQGIEVNSVPGFKFWVRTYVRPFFPHEMLIAGMVRHDFTEIAIDGLLAVDFSIAYVDEVRSSHGAFMCPTLNAWFSRGYHAQFFDPIDERGSTHPWTTEFDKFALRNVAAHGVISADHRRASYFSFSRVPGPLNARHALLLEMLVPHLHQAYARVATTFNARAARADLSNFEITLLHWISKGKSDSDIAAVLNHSPHAVKYGVRRLLAKLNVATRHEAVAQAVWLDATGIDSNHKGTSKNQKLSF